MLVTIAILASISTLVGGFFALRFRDKLHLILGFSAGAVIGVAFFDLLPEAISLAEGAYSVSSIATIIAIGFLVYLLLDRVVFLHAHTHGEGEEDDIDKVESEHVSRGILGAASLSIHSFLDGVAIGLAFQAGTAIGLIVALAVLTHDFSDGINTVSMIVKNGGDLKKALRWLVADALAPVLGVISTLFFSLPAHALSVILALFCGFFLYIGASDLIPESHHAHPRLLTSAMTVLGALVLYAVVHLANI